MNDQEPKTGSSSEDQPEVSEPTTGSGIREVTYKMPATRESAQATEAAGADLNNIEAQTVMMRQSGAEHITADRVVMEQSGSKFIEAKSTQMDQSGVVALSSDHTVLMQSSAVQIVADEVRMSKSSALIVNARQARVEESSIFLFAGTADAEVKPVFTVTTAAVMGAAFGLIFALVTLAIRIASGRD